MGREQKAMITKLGLGRNEAVLRKIVTHN